MSGEILSLIVAVMWTFTALFAEVASRSMGATTLNVWRMVITLALIGGSLWFFCGSPIPQYASAEAWMWFLASGFMGFVFGDYCLFNSYLCIGSRFGQLFMTLASPFAAIAAWTLMGEQMTLMCILGMLVTMTGISLSILGKPEKGESLFKLPTKGILYGIGAALGQGVGLVLSKQGMLAYDLCVPASAEDVRMMMPFAGTMIRAMMGLVGFTVTLIFIRQTKTMPLLWRDRRTFTAAMLAVLLGPFFGVSLSLHASTLTNAGVAQTLMSLTPIFILWPSHVMFGSRITWREVLGAVIAVAGASLFWV